MIPANIDSIPDRSGIGSSSGRVGPVVGSIPDRSRIGSASGPTRPEEEPIPDRSDHRPDSVPLRPSWACGRIDPTTGRAQAGLSGSSRQCLRLG